MPTLAQDARLALRGFRRTPGVFVTAVVILALGVGMSVAMFSVFRTVLVRRLPVVDQDRVVVMWTYVADPHTDVVTGTKELSVVRRESRTMRRIAAIAHWPATPSPFVYGDRSVELSRGMVTGNFFDVLGARPALGRLLRPSDDEADASSPGDTRASRAMVLGYRAWRERFGGDSSVIGRHLVEPLLGTDYTIVGVAPAGLAYPAGVDYWIPMWSGWQSSVSAFAVARLAPGATVAAARDEYLAIEKRLTPQLNLRGAHAATFADTVLGSARPVLQVLTAAVGLLLAIACLNVGNLLLLRAATRARELVVRRALGAGFGDLARPLVVEALAIAAAGGALGLLVAATALRTLVRYAPVQLPRLDEVRLAGAPVGVATAIATLAVLVFGVAPALLVARGHVAAPLRLDARAGHETARRRALRHALVASQMALAMVMSGGAALLARSLARLEWQDTGFASDHLSVLWYSWNAHKQDSVPELIALGDRLARRVRAIPGVTAATPIVAPPMLGNGVWQVRFEVEGQAPAAVAENPLFPVEMGGPEFFRTFGVRLVRGRAFTARDDAASPLVVIVSESVARRLWPGRDPLGKRVRIPGANAGGIAGGDGWRTVVGVAHDTRLRTLREVSPTVFFPSLQGYWQGSIAIRSATSLSALVPALRAAGREVDPDVELWSRQTMDEILAEPLAEPRLGALLTSSFSAVALLLSGVGLFGAMAALVRDRTREFGIRMALGAAPGRVRLAVLRRAAIVVGSGAAVGLAITLVASRLLAALLFDVSATDPLALGGACGALLAVALVAALVPARAATRVDPARTLRAD
ncbi:ADOP family duplicated permease [Gemmatirosa kalamazoonensis]|nr:ADOP family duplicated permease [Gemmatirosa kalamazoonensis]